ERQRREQGQLQQQAADLRRRADALADAEQELADQQYYWEKVRQTLHQETEGLENRIRNHRRKIDEQERVSSRLEASVAERRPHEAPSALPTVTAAPAMMPDTVAEAAKAQQVLGELFEERLASVERLADQVADQRLHLAEQFERLGWLQLGWAQDREEAVAEL